jgi:plastocyanin
MSLIRPSTSLAVLAGLAVVVAACTGTSASPAASTPTAGETRATPSPPAGDSPDPSASEPSAGQVTVSMDGSEFIPAELTIAAGTELIFVNVSQFGHTVTEGSGGRAVEDPFVDVEVAEGEREGVTFEAPGTYEITCRIHPTMELTITVED